MTATPAPAKSRGKLVPDLIAGLTTSLVTIPDGMASAVLAGLNPVQGLYALMVGTPIAALTASSQFMYVANTGALAVATGSALAAYSGDQLLSALAVLVILIGLLQLTLGLLKAGGVVRFVSNGVLVGFMTGIALLIILGQLGDFTGYHGEYSNKVVQAIDLALHIGQIDVQATIIGLVAIVLIIVLHRTPLAKFNMIIALIGASLLAALLGWTDVELIKDIADIPSGLGSFPRPVLPDIALIPELLPSAIAVAIIGLVQPRASANPCPTRTAATQTCRVTSARRAWPTPPPASSRACPSAAPCRRRQSTSRPAPRAVGLTSSPASSSSLRSWFSAASSNTWPCQPSPLC
jgi:SulP family sulfate permease